MVEKFGRETNSMTPDPSIPGESTVAPPGNPGGASAPTLPLPEAKQADLDALRERHREAIRQTFSRIDPLALGVAVGAFLALVVMLATWVLVWKGGENVGANLQVLRSYCPGYAVTMVGGAVGGLYGLAYGFGLGFLVAWSRNLSLRIVLYRARRQADQWRRQHLLDEI